LLHKQTFFGVFQHLHVTKKNKKYFGSDTAKNVLIIGFLLCCNKKKQKKKEPWSCYCVFKQYKNYKRKENRKKCGKTQNKPFFLKGDTDLSFFCFFFVFLPLGFQFPTRRHCFPPTGDLLNFRYLSFMQMNKNCSRKTNLP
jgi:hypothetical protein